MDAATHAMTGVFIGSLAAVRREDALYPLLLTGAVAAIVPDLDGLMIPFVDYNTFRIHHRVFTHNVFVLPIIALIGAAPAWIWVRRDYLFFYLISFLVVISHMVLDMLCVWELYLLKPFSDKDFSLKLVKKDTSYAAPALSTLAAMAMIYHHHRRQKRGLNEKTRN